MEEDNENLGKSAIYFLLAFLFGCTCIACVVLAITLGPWYAIGFIVGAIGSFILTVVMGILSSRKRQ